MSSFQVDIKNVGLIRKGSIEFRPGFTVIRGPSGSGKSTLMRAIEDTIYNTPGDSTVTFGEAEQAVRIIYNGTTVIRKKDLKSKDGKVLYKVNGDVFTKTGRAILDEVVKPLKMEELELLSDKIRLNFVNQFSVPFLVKEPPSKIFEIVTSDSQMNLLDILKAMRADGDELNHARKTNSALIDQLQCQISQDEATVNALSMVPEHLNKLNDLEPLNAKLARISGLISSTLDHLGKAKQHMARLKAVDAEIEAIDALKDPQPLIDRNERLSHLIELAEIVSLQLEQEGKKAGAVFPELDISRCQLLSSMVSLLVEADGHLSSLHYKLDEASVEIEKAVASLSEFKVCPLCNSPLQAKTESISS